MEWPLPNSQPGVSGRGNYPARNSRPGIARRAGHHIIHLLVNYARRAAVGVARVLGVILQRDTSRLKRDMVGAVGHRLQIDRPVTGMCALGILGSMLLAVG